MSEMYRRGGDAPDLVPPTLAAGPGRSAPDPEDDLVGSTLAGRYHILRRLGEGAMGNVYLGEHVKIGRQDAIKVLRNNLATDRDAIARFLRGTRNVSAIRHPNVCTIYDYSDTEDGLQFVAMEFVPGETLKDLLHRAGVLPLARAVDITAQTAEALEAAHAAGIVHRDLKPANIMVMQSRTGTDEVKVVDFDIAKGREDGDEEEVTRLGFVIGTPEYMSPEQLVGERLDGRSDIYSLALVLFRTLTGKLPFGTDSGQEVILRRLTERPLLLAEASPEAAFPEELERVIHRALSRRPQDRHSSVQDFGREVIASVGGVVAADRRQNAYATPSEAQARPLPLEPEPVVRPAEDRKSSGSRILATRKNVIWGAIAAAGMLAGSIGAVMMMRPGATEQPLSPAERVLEAVEPTPATDVGATGSQGVPVDVPVTAANLGGASGPGGGSAPGGVGEPTPAPPASTPPVGQPAASAVTAVNAEEVLFELLGRLDPNASRPVLAGVRDTAEFVFDLPGVATNERAFAAYILGNALLPLGDTVGSVSWLEQAVRLRPDGPGYQQLLDTYRQLLSP
ncbi:MAG: protein kinase [Gemmatimonas sp.]|nr:protein kinase [Gemmatimonas sp.]